MRGIADDRNRHAWHLALAGLRRGEIAGQRWADIDLENRTLQIGATRVDVGGRAFDQDEPKTANSAIWRAGGTSAVAPSAQYRASAPAMQA